MYTVYIGAAADSSIIAGAQCTEQHCTHFHDDSSEEITSNVTTSDKHTALQLQYSVYSSYAIAHTWQTLFLVACFTNRDSNLHGHA
jgi:hypothetical protein